MLKNEIKELVYEEFLRQFKNPNKIIFFEFFIIIAAIIDNNDFQQLTNYLSSHISIALAIINIIFIAIFLYTIFTISIMTIFNIIELFKLQDAYYKFYNKWFDMEKYSMFLEHFYNYLYGLYIASYNGMIWFLIISETVYILNKNYITNLIIQLSPIQYIIFFKNHLFFCIPLILFIVFFIFNVFFCIINIIKNTFYDLFYLKKKELNCIKPMEKNVQTFYPTSLHRILATI